MPSLLADILPELAWCASENARFIPIEDALRGLGFSDETPRPILKEVLETGEEKKKESEKETSEDQGKIPWSLIHKDIKRVSERRFKDGYYSDAVESAFKEISSRIKQVYKAKKAVELDGKPLMAGAFSPKDPVICLGDTTTQTGRNIQEGYMRIFVGCWMGIRSPKAHEQVEITEERAIHFLFVASLLMSKLDEAL
jgi:uncharacterized protein (TIGR02391 family)